VALAGVAVLGVLRLPGVRAWLFVWRVERVHARSRLRGWTDGQRACVLVRNGDPAIVRCLLRHPDRQVRFSAGCATLNLAGSAWPPGRLAGRIVPAGGFSDEDIDRAFEALQEGFAVRDPRSAGLRRYIAEHTGLIYEKRLVRVLAHALRDEDVARGTSGLTARSTLYELTGRLDVDDWAAWCEANYDGLRWNGEIFVAEGGSRGGP